MHFQLVKGHEEREYTLFDLQKFFNTSANYKHDCPFCPLRPELDKDGIERMKPFAAQIILDATMLVGEAS